MLSVLLKNFLVHIWDHTKISAHTQKLNICRCLQSQIQDHLRSLRLTKIKKLVTELQLMVEII